MGLSNSLYLGYSGMATHQKCLDNTGNNLANVNTTGFKQKDFGFSTLFSQALNTGNTPATGMRSSVNPKTAGMGVTIGATTTNFRQGPIEYTGNPLDFAITGRGFFLAKTGSGGLALTRDGSFYSDPSGMLCVGNGLPVQGWMAQNGVVTPSTTVENIYIPPLGSILKGQNTNNVILSGVLPTNTNTSDFGGIPTTDLALKGDLAAGNTLTTSVYVASNQTGGNAYSNEVREVQVQINFSGPTPSGDGTASSYSWTMTTMDWPNPGDPPVQIYPMADDPGFSRGTVSFHNQANATDKYGVGQAIQNTVSPGSTMVKSVSTDANGNEIVNSFTMPSGFTVDVSRLTNLGNAPGGNGLETWSVNGNPKGTMARTVTVYDTQTSFIQTTDANGNVVVNPEASVEARDSMMFFTYEGADDVSRTWSWRSSNGDRGTLAFGTDGSLVAAGGNAGTPKYDFSDMRSINYNGSIEIVSQDGYRDGVMRELATDQYGKIYARYSNGITDLIAQIAMGDVPNPAGLLTGSSTLFYVGSASGELMIGTPGDEKGSSSGLPAIGAGSLTSGSLESSNVDLTNEFATMITTERGYQLNSRVVSVSNEMLQTLLNVKR